MEEPTDPRPPERHDNPRGRKPGETEAEYRARFERAWQFSHDAGGTDEADQ